MSNHTTPAPTTTTTTAPALTPNGYLRKGTPVIVRRVLRATYITGATTDRVSIITGVVAGRRHYGGKDYYLIDTPDTTPGYPASYPAHEVSPAPITPAPEAPATVTPAPVPASASRYAYAIKLSSGRWGRLIGAYVSATDARAAGAAAANGRPVRVSLAR